MSRKEKFLVVRPHTGDRDYVEGETREGVRAEFAHLIPHVLLPEADTAKAKAEAEAKAREEAEAKAKAAPNPQNQAEGDYANKADNRRQTK